MGASVMTKEQVMDRLRPVYERAAREMTGVSFLLTDEEMKVFNREDMVQLEVEAGYSQAGVEGNRHDRA